MDHVRDKLRHRGSTYDSVLRHDCHYRMAGDSLQQDVPYGARSAGDSVQESNPRFVPSQRHFIAQTLHNAGAASFRWDRIDSAAAYRIKLITSPIESALSTVVR